MRNHCFRSVAGRGALNVLTLVAVIVAPFAVTAAQPFIPTRGGIGQSESTSTQQARLSGLATGTSPQAKSVPGIGKDAGLEIESIDPITPSDPMLADMLSAPEVTGLKLEASDWYRGYIVKYAASQGRVAFVPLHQQGLKENKILMIFFDPAQPQRKQDFLMFKSMTVPESKMASPDTESAEMTTTLETLDGDTLAIGSIRKGKLKWTEPEQSGTIHPMIRWSCFRGCFFTVRLTAQCAGWCSPCATCLRVPSWVCSVPCFPCVVCLGGAALGCWNTCK